MQKLEKMHKLFTHEIFTEIGWDEEFIDADMLRLIAIFILIKSQSAKFLTDISLIEEFTP